MNKITITVTGKSASGKTTIADLLYEFLVEQGFATTQIEFEKLDETRRTTYKDARIQAVKSNTDIVIEEKNAPLRSSLG